MSKSLGNVIEPEKIIKQYGAEMLRLWVASVEFNEDVRLSDTILDAPDGGVSQAPQHVPLCSRQSGGFRSRGRRGAGGRDAAKWTSGFCCEPRTWCADAAGGTTNSRSTRSITRVYDFATVELSSVYFDISRTGCTRPRQIHARRSAQTALYRINYALVRLLAPLMSFTAEEVWAHMRKPKASRRASISRCSPSRANSPPAYRTRPAKRQQEWDRLMEVRKRSTQEPGAGPPEKADRRSARSAGAPVGEWRSISPLLEKYAARSPGSVHRVASYARGRKAIG